MTQKLFFQIDSKVTLAGAPQPLVAELTRNFTIDNPAYRDAEKQGRWTGDLEPELSFSSLEGNNLTLPRGAARHIYETACRYGEVKIIDNRLSLPEIDLSFGGQLRPYQQQAVEGSHVKEFGILEAGTGSGKTIMALAIIAARRQPTLILVHTKELLYQWQDRIKDFLGIEAGLIGGGHFDIQPVTVGIVNSVRAHLHKLTDKFGHLVVDECHRVPSTMFTETVSAFPAKYMLGLSATPYRRDGLDKLIGWYIGSHRVSVNTAILQQVGAVLRPKIISRETNFNYSYNDDYSTMVSALVNDEERNDLIAGDIEDQAEQGGLSLVVSDRTEHLKTLEAMTGLTGSAILTGKTPAKQRKQIVADLHGGKVRILFSTLSLIGEGFDCPNMDCLFLTTPIKFSGRLTQTVGRVLRPAEGKIPTVYDYIDTRVGLLKHQARARQKIYNEM